MRRLGLIAGWLVAAGVVTFAAWQAVKVADAQVSQQPLTPLAVAPTGDLIFPTSTDAAISGSQSPSTGEPSTPTTNTTSPPASASTTVGNGDQWTILPLNSAGGSVIVAFRPGEVRLESATPLPGFVLAVDEEGQGRVEVEFRGAGVEHDIRVRWHNGQLETSIETSGSG